MSHKSIRAFWSSPDIDWTRNDHDLGRALDERPAVVGYWRKKLHKRKSPNKWRHVEQIQDNLKRYRRWDWSLTGTELARLHGMSKQRVSVIRKKVFEI